ncbi:hypothetical protein T07_11460 [Trichinella nelsoni]|uniref:Uncharacterized protein n=1 Tax=Trichinella nelsoni TaxID=6336 RepID=A0A0V0RDW7_9BILA|nr:hypothetical protein T07_11460 [Trichinella nelsoni]
MNYTFAFKALLCRYRSNPVLVEIHINVTMNFFLSLYILAIETLKLTGIQSLYILKMWQFDYAFRLHHGMDDLRSPVVQALVQVGVTFRFVLAIKTSQRSQCHVDYYKMHLECGSHACCSVIFLRLCLGHFPKIFQFFKNLASGVARGYAPGYKKICIFPQAMPQALYCTLFTLKEDLCKFFYRLGVIFKFFMPSGYASGYALGVFKKILGFSEF